MSRTTRRRFLQGSSALALTTAWPASIQAAPTDADGGPDLIILGGTVYTIDEKRPTAEAFAVKNSRFQAIGNRAAIARLATRGTQVIDAAKQTIVPGFIDAHCHPAAAGLSELLDVNCDRRTIADIQKAIQERAGRLAAGEWVYGFKYDDTKLMDGRPLTRADLDKAAPKHPVRVVHRGGHTCCRQLGGLDAGRYRPQDARSGRRAVSAGMPRAN